MDFRKKVVRVELLGEQWFTIMCKISGRVMSDEGADILKTASASLGEQVLHSASDVARGRRDGPKALAKKFPIGPGNGRKEKLTAGIFDPPKKPALKLIKD